MARVPSRIKVGTRLGPDLTVLGIVTDRGRGPVLLVWHHKSWCPMACKVFKSSEQAQREADIVMAVAHPYIVRCLGMNGSNYLLMEYLEGPSLHDLMKNRPQRPLGMKEASRVPIHV